MINSYYNCVLFKKYYQYNLWFGNFAEYNNIKYCKKYIQRYIYFWTQIFLLQRFSLSFVIFLYKSPYFIKFVESGFFKYLDYHFLFSFYSNCFTFDLKGQQKIKIFVKFYFQFFLKKHFEKDLLILVIKVINKIILNVLIKYLINHLKYIQTCVNWTCLNNKTLVELVTIKKSYLIGFFYPNYLNIISYYKLSFVDLNHLYNLKFVYKSLLKYLNFKDSKYLNINLKPVKISKVILTKFFTESLQKTSYYFNKDVQYLIEFVEILSWFNNQKNIGLYKNSNILFINFLVRKPLFFKKPFKTFKFFFKSFNFFFFKHRYKKKLNLKFIMGNNLYFFNKGSKKKNYFLKAKKKNLINNKKKSSTILKNKFIITLKISLIKDNKIFNNCLCYYNTHKYFLI